MANFWLKSKSHPTTDMIVCTKSASLKFQFEVVGTAVRKPSLSWVCHCDSRTSAQVFPAVYGNNMLNIALTRAWAVWIQPATLHRVSLSEPAFDSIFIFCKTRCSKLSLPFRFFYQTLRAILISILLASWVFWIQYVSFIAVEGFAEWCRLSVR